MAEVDYSGPRLHTLANGLQFELSSLPEETPALESYFRWAKPKAGETVFDIGAYCGVFTYILSQLVGPTGRVVAFEPDPINLNLLLRNVRRHGLQNVNVEGVALCDREGEMIFNSQGSLGSGFANFADRSAQGNSVTVRTMTLDSACERYGVPSFVKIDAEGAEIEILSCARNLLSVHSAAFVLDTNHFRDGALTAARVESIFRQNGYEAESSALPVMTTWARKLSK
ncbi:MAG: FkbM family methyltransferase [Acidobacteria bacterium]|nr:FkbM family methyltransferase [Acidobacteriota bacterium]